MYLWHHRKKLHFKLNSIKLSIIFHNITVLLYFWSSKSRFSDTFFILWRFEKSLSTMCKLIQNKIGSLKILMALSRTVMARFHWAVRYGKKLFPFPLSEFVNGTKIANHTTFWYPSVGVPSTAKGTKTVELKSLQNIDWLTRIVTFAWYKGIKLLLHSFRSAVFGLLHQRAHTQKK